jgi:hypothetical protein
MAGSIASVAIGIGASSGLLAYSLTVTWVKAWKFSCNIGLRGAITVIPGDFPAERLIGARALWMEQCAKLLKRLALIGVDFIHAQTSSMIMEVGSTRRLSL